MPDPVPHPSPAAGSSQPVDPRPRPPVQPALEDCCLSGCSPCVFDLYEQALERYELALAQWQARHPSGA
jgi:hypothetical protein